MRFFSVLAFLIPFLSAPVLAQTGLPQEVLKDCRKWENGFCVEGGLTDLAKSLRAEEQAEAKQAGSCGKICKEACPNCSKCNLCSFCWIYNSDSCKGVGYYTDPETCTEKQTESCCDLCEAHCGSNGACAEKEYCKGGDKSTSTIVKCIEQTQGEICERCVVK